MKGRLLVVTLLVAVLGTGCTLERVQGPRSATDDPASPRPLPSVTLEQSDEAGPVSPLADVIEEVLPSVVNVRVRAVDFDPFGEAQVDEGQGSGVVIDRNGIILTNNHVVRNATEVSIHFTDEREELEGEVIGTVPERDIAVVRVQADDLSPIEIGRSDDMRLGDDVLALGFPLGLGGVTATRGIISATDRNIQVQASAGLPGRLEGLLQTDAAINPGNSGGALVNSAGRLVGINTAAASAGAAENVGFAIPIDTAIPLAEEILSEPAEQRAWLGVQIESVSSSAIASQLGLDPDVRGAAIAGLFPDSPAEEAGLEQGDVIVSLNGNEITSAEGLTRALTRIDAGETIDVIVLRDGERRSIEVVVGARPGTLEPPE